MKGILLWSFLSESLTDATKIPGIHVKGRIAAIPEIPLWARATDVPMETTGSPS